MNVLTVVTKSIMVLVLLGAISACSLLKSNKGEEVELQINVAEQVNPDELGRSSPVVIRLYELKKNVAIEGLEFFSVYDQTEADFKASVISMKEFQVNPGQLLQQMVVTDVSTTHLMLVAAFKDIDNSQWKVIHDLDETHELVLTIEGKAIVKQ